jgi:hypothetical protein
LCCQFWRRAKEHERARRWDRRPHHQALLIGAFLSHIDSPRRRGRRSHFNPHRQLRFARSPITSCSVRAGSTV